MKYFYVPFRIESLLDIALNPSLSELELRNWKAVCLVVILFSTEQIILINICLVWKSFSWVFKRGLINFSLIIFKDFKFFLIIYRKLPFMSLVSACSFGEPQEQIENLLYMCRIKFFACWVPKQLCRDLQGSLNTFNRSNGVSEPKSLGNTCKSICRKDKIMTD